MAAFLVRYLIITGIGAAVAVLVPGLVVIGLFLIIPGLILALTPTAFLWGAIFAAIWWPTRPVVGTWLAALIALAGAAALVIAIPWLANHQIQAQIDALRAEDREADGPIPLRGVIRFERTAYLVAQMDDPEWQAQVAAFNAERRSIDWSQRPVACDAMCAAALFTPVVEAVIVAPVLRPGAAPRTLDRVSEFWIERAPGCTGSLTPGQPVGFQHGFTSYDALKDEWRVLISQGNCIRRGPVRRKADFTIAITDWTLDGTTWSLTHARTSILRMEVRASSGEVLLRRTSVNTAKLDPVLWIIGTGDLSSFHFDWGRKRPSDGEVPGAFTPVNLLAELTPLRVRSDPRAVTDAVRSQLALTLSDPARPRDDPAFALPERVFDDIGNNGLRPGDAELVERIISDPRTSQLGGIWHVIRKMGPESVRLRDPIVKRLLAARYPDDQQTGRQIGPALSALPAGIFATPTDDEVRLLDDPDRRNWATGLVARQADRGAAAVPILTRILVEGWSRPLPEEKSHRTRDVAAAQAARRGLCVLGPVAQSVLPAIEGLVAAGHIPQRELDDRPWQLTLARLGRPIESFRSPPNHNWSDAQLQDSLRQRLARFNPARDCD
jgi:hypothetical protein